MVVSLRPQPKTNKQTNEINNNIISSKLPEKYIEKEMNSNKASDLVIKSPIWQELTPHANPNHSKGKKIKSKKNLFFFLKQQTRINPKPIEISTPAS